MTKEKYGGLEVEEDMRFERRIWTAQRIGWLLLACFVLAALFGVFGAGTFSTTTASAGGFELAYERFVRRGGPTEMEVTVHGVAGRTEIWIDRSYLQSVQIESISPQPDSVSETRDRAVFTIVGEGTVTVRIDARADELGRQTGRAGIEGGGAVEFWQFMYP